MHLSQVRYVIALNEEMQFTAAARRCGVSQPTLTVGIRKLEDELGQRLFVRKPDVTLTEFGRRVLAQFYAISDAYAAIGKIVADVSQPHALPTPQKDRAQIAGGP
jgi:DNA-binding transcriptional LysR family regulator